MSETWICGYVLEFSDGGNPEEQVLHIGPREDCERVADLLPAVSYSGPRPDPRAVMVVKPYPKDDPGGRCDELAVGAPLPASSAAAREEGP